MTCTNDIYSDTFESKMDPYFKSDYLTNDRLMGRLDQDSARSALATTRPRGSRYWGNAPLGMRIIGNGHQKAVS